MKATVCAALCKIAAKYREENPDNPKGGFVVIYDGRVAGWTHSVSEVSGWLAGCYAIPDIAGEPIREAVGGNYQNGAEKWVPVAFTLSDCVS